MEEYYTIKEYAELKGFSLKQKTMILLGRNARKIELNNKDNRVKRYKKEEKGAFPRGRRDKNGKFKPSNIQGVRSWPVDILKEVFNG